MKGVICALVVLAMIQFMAKPGEAISCGQVTGPLAPCRPFLTGKSPNPSPDCCNAIKTLKGQLPTKADRQAACNCMKQATASDKSIKDAAAAALPGKCGTQVGAPISRNVDCSKIP